ncbi:hypothetical protein SUGI_1189820 [Cryptomeria japonica]|nr:hypothetical protein SUGI_1189820 [Cryptomeria japonica]
MEFDKIVQNEEQTVQAQYKGNKKLVGDLEGLESNMGKIKEIMGKIEELTANKKKKSFINTTACFKQPHHL